MNAYKRICKTLRGCHLQPSFRLCLFEEGFCFDLFGFLIALPFLDRFTYEPKDMMESWGIYYYARSVVLCWGNRTKYYYTPWDYQHMNNKRVVLQRDGSWSIYKAEWDGGDRSNDWSKTYPYTYTLRSGEIQNRTATVTVEKREWRWRWFQWLSWPAKRSKTIEVVFNDEVGERSGSWKGGCIGCGYEMLPHESPEQTLRRMEKERKF